MTSENLSISDVPVPSRWRHKKTGRIAVVTGKSYVRGISWRYDGLRTRLQDTEATLFLSRFEFWTP